MAIQSQQLQKQIPHAVRQNHANGFGMTTKRGPSLVITSSTDSTLKLLQLSWWHVV